tara:strand:+ start:2509 stop:2778 length:270 start_codon:yes stop_codon:yes gene_type:complete
MKTFISKAGKLTLNKPQQKWWGEEPDVMQQSIFAGQEMVLIQKSDNEPEYYMLKYLGFESEYFLGIEQAKSRAVDFAKAVLTTMSGLVN